MILLHYREGKKLPAEGGNEDDGYLLLLVSDVEQGKISRSSLLVFDAALITAGPVAQVGLFSCLHPKPCGSSLSVTLPLCQ
jgi:carotenoid cleavage dioxygenase-like enzyme